MRILRGVLAVVLGYAVFALSAVALFQVAGRNPHAPQDMGFIVIADLIGMAFAGFGGLLASRLAPSNPNLHAALVSGLIALGAAASLLASPARDATWSQWSALALISPCPWLAARLSRTTPRK